MIDSSDQRRFPQFSNFRLWYGNGRASYDGVNLGVHMRGEKFELQGFYTYSKAKGNVLAGADEFRITDAGSQADVGGSRRDVSVDPLDPLCNACFGPLYTDARHRVTIGGLYHLPWGVELSGMLRYHSAFPYTFFLTSDPNVDGFAYDLVPGDHVNSRRGHAFSQLDLRVSKELTFGDRFGLELLAEVFNVLDAKNPAVPDRFGNYTTYAGDPLQGEQRLAQLGVRLRF